MTFRSRWLLAATTALVGFAPMTQAVLAQQTSSPAQAGSTTRPNQDQGTTTAQNGQPAEADQARPHRAANAGDTMQTPRVLRPSVEGMSALASIHRARVDLFEGDVDAARASLQTSLDAFQGKDIAKLAVKASALKQRSGDKDETASGAGMKSGQTAQGAQTASGAAVAQTPKPGAEGSGDTRTQAASDTATPAGDDLYLPVETALAIAEEFQLSPRHQDAVGHAKDAMSAGNHDEAMETLVGDGIRVSQQAVMVPLHGTVSNLKQALSDIDAGKYYEANIALRTIERSVRVQSFQGPDIPQQGGDAAQTG